MFEGLKRLFGFIKTCYNVYKSQSPDTNRMYSDILKLFQLYRAEQIKEAKEKEKYDMLTKGLSYPIIRDIGEQVKKMGLAAIITFPNGERVEVFPFDKFEQGKMAEIQWAEAQQQRTEIGKVNG